MSDNNSMQPKLTGTGRRPGIPQYAAGAKRSVSRLANLGYDPIKELVDTSNYIKAEIKRWEEIRAGTLVEILGERKDGEPILLKYSWTAHQALIDKLIVVGEKLLRYGYGRVPEVEAPEKQKNRLGLTVKLSSSNDTLIINSNPDQDESEEDGYDPLASDLVDYGAMDVQFKEK